MNTKNNKEIDKVHISVQFIALFVSTIFASLIPYLLNQDIFPEGFSVYARVFSLIFQSVFFLYFFFEYIKTKEKQSLLFSFIFLLLILLEILSLSGDQTDSLSVISKGVVLIFILLGMALPKQKFFTKEWFFQDINFWRLFSLVFLVMSSVFSCMSLENFSLWSQLISYIALLMGYGNEIRNNLIQNRK